MSHLSAKSSGLRQKGDYVEYLVVLITVTLIALFMFTIARAIKSA
jgi:hypothetical protein